MKTTEILDCIDRKQKNSKIKNFKIIKVFQSRKEKFFKRVSRESFFEEENEKESLSGFAKF